MTRDGTIASGTDRDLTDDYLAGVLPDDHPIFHPDWGDWLPLSEALSHNLFSLRTAPMDADATMDELTVPRGLWAVPPPPRVAPPPAPPPAPAAATPHAWIAAPPLPPPRPPAPSFTPAGVSHTVRPPADRATNAAAVAGAAFAAAGAVVFAAALGVSLLAPAPSAARARSFPVLALLRHHAHDAASKPVLHGCRANGEPVTLASRVELDTPIDLGTLDKGRLGVGVVTTRTTGLGIELSGAPLGVVAKTPLGDPVHVGGVVPIDGGFSADRFLRTVPAGTRFQLGMTPLGFSRFEGHGAPSVVWSGEASEVSSRPNLAHAPGIGWLVAFRRGAETGTVRSGWLDEQGRAKTELQTFPEESGVVEAPDVALDDHDYLIAFAARQPAEAPWSIELAQGALGAPASAAVPLAGPALDRRAVSVAKSSSGHFLLAFAEGDRTSGRAIYLTKIDAALHADAPVLLGRAADYVGKTAIWSDGEHAVVLFTERTGRQTERLRGIAVDCR